jgi:S1-C subfamily serine protease
MRRTWLIFSQAVTVAVAVLFVIATLKPDWLQRRSVSGLPGGISINAVQPVSLGSAGAAAPNSYSAAAKRATPAVVSITASKAPPRSPHTTDPWFQFFFGDRARQMQQEPQVGLGSGVIVSPEGYLLTNVHVIDGATEIEVMLPDGRKAKPKVIGLDPETDVAVLKIELDKLPAVA